MLLCQVWCKLQAQDIQVSPTADENSKRIDAKNVTLLKDTWPSFSFFIFSSFLLTQVRAQQ